MLFSDSRYKWYHMIFVFLCLTYFTQYENLQPHPCYCKWHYFLPFYGWVKFHLYLFIYMYIHTHTIHIYIYIYIFKIRYQLWTGTSKQTLVLEKTYIVSFKSSWLVFSLICCWANCWAIHNWYRVTQSTLAQVGIFKGRLKSKKLLRKLW
jgi:GT2 family glycosyltransferase